MFMAAFGVLWLLVLFQGVLILLMYRHFGLMSLETAGAVSRDGLRIGDSAPTINGVNAAGLQTSWVPERERFNLVLFAAPECEPCAQVLPDIAILGLDDFAPVSTLVVVPGSSEDARAVTDKYGSSLRCLAEGDAAVFDAYRVRVTPFAFVIDPYGRVARKGVCSNPQLLHNLLDVTGDVELLDRLVARQDTVREERQITI